MYMEPKISQIGSSQKSVSWNDLEEFSAICKTKDEQVKCIFNLKTVIEESQLNELMKNVMEDMQSYLNKFSPISSKNHENQIQGGQAVGSVDLDPVNVINATILGACHFQSLEGTNIKQNINQSSEIFSINLAPSDFKITITNKFRESLIQHYSLLTAQQKQINQLRIQRDQQKQNENSDKTRQLVQESLERQTLSSLVENLEAQNQLKKEIESLKDQNARLAQSEAQLTKQRDEALVKIKNQEEKKKSDAQLEQHASLESYQIPRMTYQIANQKNHFKTSPLIGKKENFINFIVDKLGQKLVSVKMIFNAKENGWRAQDFHAKCDGQGPTISFIQIKDGPCIGGFTTSKWGSFNSEENQFLTDRYAFLFNLDDKIHIPVKDQEHAIAGHSGNGPTFGNGDLVVFSKFNEPGHLRSLSEEKTYNIPEIKGQNILTKSKSQRTTIQDLEVWQVKFNQEYQNEYCMQWIDTKFANEGELLIRQHRLEWESSNGRQGKSKSACFSQ